MMKFFQPKINTLGPENHLASPSRADGLRLTDIFRQRQPRPKARSEQKFAKPWKPSLTFLTFDTKLAVCVISGVENSRSTSVLILHNLSCAKSAKLRQFCLPRQTLSVTGLSLELILRYLGSYCLSSRCSVI
jgi:hypothetical protein